MFLSLEYAHIKSYSSIYHIYVRTFICSLPANKRLRESAAVWLSSFRAAPFHGRAAAAEGDRTFVRPSVRLGSREGQPVTPLQHICTMDEYEWECLMNLILIDAFWMMRNIWMPDDDWWIMEYNGISWMINHGTSWMILSLWLIMDDSLWTMMENITRWWPQRFKHQAPGNQCWNHLVPSGARTCVVKEIVATCHKTSVMW